MVVWLCMLSYRQRFFPMKELEKAFSKNALLGGHPENHIPSVEVLTVVLGHGFSLAVGMAKA